MIQIDLLQIPLRFFAGRGVAECPGGLERSLKNRLDVRMHHFTDLLSLEILISDPPRSPYTSRSISDLSWARLNLDSKSVSQQFARSSKQITEVLLLVAG